MLSKSNIKDHLLLSEMTERVLTAIDLSKDLQRRGQTKPIPVDMVAEALKVLDRDENLMDMSTWAPESITTVFCTLFSVMNREDPELFNGILIDAHTYAISGYEKDEIIQAILDETVHTNTVHYIVDDFMSLVPEAIEINAARECHPCIELAN